VSRADYEAQLVRSICRSVIRRVKQENPSLKGEELLRHLNIAAPFRWADPGFTKLQAIWQEEVAMAVPTLSGEIIVTIH
jgi:hypothetical protein